MSSKKIWQYPEATSITNDDYILMDSNTETGSQCLKANKIGAVHITKTVTERKVYKASDDNANGFSEVTVAVPYTDVHYDKDDIVSFVGENLPLKSVTAYIEPQQDLHGYDAPWPAGGGKNKCGEFELGTLSESSAQGSTYDNMKVSNTARMRSKTLIEIPSTCTISCANGYQYAFAGYDANMEYLGVYQFYTWRSEAYTFNNSTIKYIAIIIKRTDEGNIQSNDYTNCHIQLEEGTTATTFAPYSNICPISGWSAVDVNKSGVNLFDKTTIIQKAYVNDSTGAVVNSTASWSDVLNASDWISVTPNTAYYHNTGGQSSSNYLAWYDLNKNYISGQGSHSSSIITSPSNAYFLRITIHNDYVDSCSVNYPSTDTEYHAYNGQIYTIQLGDTYYGGKVDLVSGVMTVDRAYVDLGSLTYVYEDSDTPKRFRAGLTPAPKVAGKVICSSYLGKQVGVGALNNGELCISGTQTYPWLRIRDDAITDATTFKTSVSGQTLVYELATPLTIQLTPTQVNSLLGVNNVWADTGEIAVEWQTLYVTPTT